MTGHCLCFKIPMACMNNFRTTTVLLKKTNQGENIMELVKIILAVILPPLGVFLQVGIGKHFWINILLTLLGYIPGIVHAIWVVAKNK